jgi:hypothetical protein
MGFMVCRSKWQIFVDLDIEKKRKNNKTYKTKSAITISHVALCPNKN